MYMLAVQGLTKTFTKTSKKGRRLVKEDFNAVDRISFEANKGEIVGILGPNGAGKTTLLRMLGGILTPSEGGILLDGQDFLQQRQEMKKQIGYLSANTKLYGRITPRELLMTFGKLYALDQTTIEAHIEVLCDVLELHSFCDNRIENLSTGQTQRVSIARCLIHSPACYILDEPTLGLDVLSSQSIIRFMKEERDQGKLVLYSTHYMEEAETLCDRVIMIHEGRILAQGTKEAIKALTQTENLRDAFLSAVAQKGGDL